MNNISSGDILFGLGLYNALGKQEPPIVLCYKGINIHCSCLLISIFPKTISPFKKSSRHSGSDFVDDGSQSSSKYLHFYNAPRIQLIEPILM